MKGIDEDVVQDAALVLLVREREWELIDQPVHGGRRRILDWLGV
jgi:hypothetical protein